MRGREALDVRNTVDRAPVDDPVDEDAGDSVVEDEPAGEEFEQQHGSGRQPSRVRAFLRRFRPAVVLAVVAIVVVLAGALFLVRASQLRDTPAASNDALVDTSATSQVIGDVTDGLQRVFSYSYQDTSATGDAARQVLAGKARGQYEKLFSQVTKHAAEQKLVLKTTVVEAGVTTLQGDDATVLAFLDQHATRGDTGKSSASAAQLAVTAHHTNGHWLITGITAK